MTGKQGQAITNDDGTIFDPLEWMIEETHARNMQFMGWMNAYRVSARTLFDSNSNSYSETEVKTAVNNAISALDDSNWAKKNSRYVLLGDSDSKMILNPGESQVRNFLVKSIREIVTNYDIDGVHFDDYFYLDSTNSSAAERVVNNATEYAAADTAFNDYYNDFETYFANRLPNETLADFRRRSVNLMIKGISDMIKEVNETMNKSVEFGAKPAAVWTSSARDVSGRIDGANVTAYSYSSYFDIFADSLYWAEQGWIDWIAPQIYFNFTNQEVPYADIVKWWAEAIEVANTKLKAEGKKEVRLFIAHGVYRLSTSEEASKRITDETELNKQLLFNQNFDTITGSSFYDYSTFTGTTTLIKNTRANLNILWNKKTLPVINTDECDLYIDQVTMDTENKTLTIADSDCKAYVVYKCDNQDDCNSSNVVDIIYGHEELVCTIDDCDATYYVQGVDDEYALSKYYYKVSQDSTYISTTLYIGDELKIEDGYELQMISDNDILSFENNTLTSKTVGKAFAVFEKDGQTLVYICTALEITYYNVHISLEDGYTLTMNQGEKVREGSSIVFTFALNEGYTDSSPKIKINNSSAPISGEYTYHNVQSDLEISITGVEKNTYYVTIRNYDEETVATVLYGENCVLPTPKEVEGKIFRAWSNSGENITENVVIRTLYTDITYNISFETNGGKALNDELVFYNDYLSEIIPTREGYTFIGWYTDSELTNAFDYTDIITSDLTLYAKWEKNSGCKSIIKIYNFFFTFPLALVIILHRKKY